MTFMLSPPTQQALVGRTRIDFTDCVVDVTHNELGLGQCAIQTRTEFDVELPIGALTYCEFVVGDRCVTGEFRLESITARFSFDNDLPIYDQEWLSNGPVTTGNHGALMALLEYPEWDTTTLNWLVFADFLESVSDSRCEQVRGLFA